MKRSGHTLGEVHQPTTLHVVDRVAHPPLGTVDLTHEQLLGARVVLRPYLFDGSDDGEIFSFGQHEPQHATPSQISEVALLQQPGEDTP